MVDSIAKAHKGNIKIESEPGQGSVFMVQLPIDSITKT
ncbi:hypothetical protein ACFLZM_08640 [Thermodesulfobacteriota bacterium]